MSTQAALGMIAAPSLSLARLPHVIAWTWLFLLQFNVSNQSLSLEEDAANKPWRPIPAQRISIAATLWLRWMLLPLCLLISIAVYGVIQPALALTVFIVLYNEAKFNVHWIMRNVFNGLLGVSFTFGATHIACGQLKLLCRIHASSY